MEINKTRNNILDALKKVIEDRKKEYGYSDVRTLFESISEVKTDDFSLHYVEMGWDEDAAWMILMLKENNDEYSFWKIPGWHNSYDGYIFELENIYKTEKKQKIITYWR